LRLAVNAYKDIKHPALESMWEIPVLYFIILISNVSCEPGLNKLNLENKQ